MLQIKRVYEKSDKADGERILVDRLWPRGLSKQKAKADIWLKELGPSTELRQWFGHDPGKWAEFKSRYRRELKTKESLLDLIREKAEHGMVTLLYGARDTEHNEAVVIKEFLNRS